MGWLFMTGKSLIQSTQKECTMLEYHGPLNVNGKVLVKQPREIMKWETHFFPGDYEIYGGAMESIWSTWNSSRLTNRFFFFFPQISLSQRQRCSSWMLSLAHYRQTIDFVEVAAEHKITSLRFNPYICGWSMVVGSKNLPRILNGEVWRQLESLSRFSLFLQLFFSFKVRVMFWLLSVWQPIES